MFYQRHLISRKSLFVNTTHVARTFSSKRPVSRIRSQLNRATAPPNQRFMGLGKNNKTYQAFCHSGRHEGTILKKQGTGHKKQKHFTKTFMANMGVLRIAKVQFHQHINGIRPTLEP